MHLNNEKIGILFKEKKIVFIFYRQVNHSQNVHVTITYGHSMTERKYVLFILSIVHFIVLAWCEIKYIFITGTWRYIFFLIIKFIIPFIYILIIRKLYDVRCLWYSCSYACTHIFNNTIRNNQSKYKKWKNLSATCMYKLEYSIIHMYEQIPCCFKKKDTLQ